MKQAFLFLLLASNLFAQVWSGSGSNGADGALNLGANSPGVVNNTLFFDPVQLGLDADADNVFHFTTITIRDGIRVYFRANRMRRPGPVVFLASGAVNIQGVLDLSGERGHESTNNPALRRISIPGPGGYPGGVGGRVGTAPATPGQGPGGGRVVPSNDANAFRGCPGAHVTAPVPSWCSSQSTPPTYGSNLIQPLLGGSGGSGGWASAPNWGRGGGAGGGALRLSSSVHIAFGSGVGAGPSAQNCSSNYIIIADGGLGDDGYAGAGAGGAIHVQAPIVVGCATHLQALGAVVNNYGSSSEGRTRVDTNTGGLGANPTALQSLLVDVPLPPPPPFLRIVSINGVVVPDQPRFDYATPDVVFNSASPVPIVLQGINIPVNTPVTVLFTTDTGTDVSATVNLTGTVANSSATVNVTLPQGTARVFARAIW